MTLPIRSQAALHSLVQQVSGSLPSEILEMPGGASTRRYFRIPRGGKLWAVAMFVPDASRSDEITNHEPAEAAKWPFVEVSELLDRCGVAVPRILGQACDDGILLLEDLGDATLANHLLEHPEDRESLYRLAVRDLAKAQRELDGRVKTTVIGRRRFDAQLLAWEVDHFREWALDARDVVLDPHEKRVFDAAAEYMVNAIISWPYGFVHRDYQSRNLMVRRGSGTQYELVWIDFQDALLGPRVYDLVALLGDSYQSFSPAFVDARLGEYAAELQLTVEECARLKHEFLVVMVQRKLKDAGRFVFLDRVKGKTEFLSFVEPTIDKVLSALSQLGGVRELDQLQHVLQRRLR